MEGSIIMLNEYTDQATKEMLQAVVKRKQKFGKFKQLHIYSIWATISLSFLFFVYLFYTVIQPYSYSFERMFSVFVNQSINMYFLVITLGTYGLMNLLRQKREKAEKEFHALRCEIIDKSKDLWKQQDAWKERHKVFEVMKKDFDINLYHENK